MKATIQDDGRLLLETEIEDREILDEGDLDDLERLYRLLEPYWSNGGFEPFDAGEGNPFVGLTSAPCIAESMDVDDDGACAITGRLWYFGDYMVRDFIEELRNHGRVAFDPA